MGKGDVRWLTVEQCAKILGVHHETVRRWCRAGKLQHTRNRLVQGKPFLVDAEVLRKFQEDMTS